MDDNDLDLSKLISIVTDGAPAMCWSHNGFTWLLLEEMKEKNVEDLPVLLHCIIHQVNLAAKSLSMVNIISTVKKTVNFFIR